MKQNRKTKGREEAHLQQGESSRVEKKLPLPPYFTTERLLSSIEAEKRWSGREEGAVLADAKRLISCYKGWKPVWEATMAVYNSPLARALREDENDSSNPTGGHNGI